MGAREDVVHGMAASIDTVDWFHRESWLMADSMPKLRAFPLDI